MSPFLRLACPALALFLPAAATAATVTVIDFDTGYADNQEFTTDGVFLKDRTGATSDLVSLSTRGANTMSIEQVGDGDTGRGFKYDTANTYDVASPLETTSSLGSHFLRTTIGLDGALSATVPVFTFDFARAVGAVSGELWDIDGTNASATEAWRVVATLSGGGTEEILSPIGTSNRDTTSLDGQAWRFSFARAGNDITSVDFFFAGGKTRGIGAAFDNLQVTEVVATPLPAGVLLLLGGLTGLAAMRRRPWGGAG